MKISQMEHLQIVFEPDTYQGGMVGLSTASVIQFAAIKTKMMKSNQSFDVSILQNCLILKKQKQAEFNNLSNWDNLLGILTE